MGIAKISGGANNAAGVPLALAGGEYFTVPTGQGIVGQFGSITFPQLATQNPLSGQYLLNLGMYSVLQVFDQGLNYWKNVASGGPNNPWVFCSADGYNYRVLNPTGCPVGGLITAGGSGGTNGFYGYQQFGALSGLGQAVVVQNGITTLGNAVFTVTPSAGSSTWNAIVGGSINTTISFSGTVFQNGPFGGTGVSSTGSGGSNYTRPPVIAFFPPPNQGAQPYFLPSAVCTISGGAINAVTVLNQGAGLLGLPGIVVIPQPGDTTGGGAVLGWTSGNSAQVNSGALTAIWPSYYGTPVTAVPTFTFGGTSNPAPSVTAIMNFSITSFTQTTPGVGYVAAGGAFQGGIVSGSATFTNPALDKNLGIPIFPPVNVAATTGLPSLAGNFGGVNIQAVPTFSAFSTGAAASTAAVTTCNVGGQNDLIQFLSM